MLWVFLIWLVTVAFASVASAWYIRKYGSSDLAIALYVIYLAMAQILAAKILTFNFGIFTVYAPAGVLIFPFTFQLIDIVNEAFGHRITRRMIIIAFVSQVFMVLFILMATMAIPAPFWHEHKSWHAIMTLVPRIIGASWVAFFISQNIDAVLFAWLRELTQDKHLWLRNVLSDVPSLALDSFIFVFLAFYGVAPVWPLIVGQVVTKCLIGF
ncbi:MAG: queuosine precursor transporter, partial [candidate division WOR-3 bacterium]|nr:queuosine precursor transporter [candidate division WOR-3 bacterium]